MHMKFKMFDPNNCPSLRNYEPFIHLNTKTGLITINKTACDQIKLGGGDKIIFHQDDEDQENWYLQNLGKKGNGFEVRDKKGITSGVIFNNATLARKITESVLFTGLSGRCKLGEMKTVKGIGDIWTIITAALRNK